LNPYGTNSDGIFSSTVRAIQQKDGNKPPLHNADICAIQLHPTISQRVIFQELSKLLPLSGQE
jgi:hypothetical protein